MRFRRVFEHVDDPSEISSHRRDDSRRGPLDIASSFDVCVLRVLMASNKTDLRQKIGKRTCAEANHALSSIGA